MLLRLPRWSEAAIGAAFLIPVRRHNASSTPSSSCIGVVIAVAVMNGTITMEVALRAAGIGWGDEVIVPAYTFQATASAPMMAGAIPVIVDIDPNTFCIDPVAIEAAITERTRAIIPVHVASQMADMSRIMEIAEAHNLIVIEDAAHAHGAFWDGKGVPAHWATSAPSACNPRRS